MNEYRPVIDMVAEAITQRIVEPIGFGTKEEFLNYLSENGELYLTQLSGQSWRLPAYYQFGILVKNLTFPLCDIAAEDRISRIIEMEYPSLCHHLLKNAAKV